MFPVSGHPWGRELRPLCAPYPHPGLWLRLPLSSSSPTSVPLEQEGISQLPRLWGWQGFPTSGHLSQPHPPTREMA